MSLELRLDQPRSDADEDLLGRILRRDETGLAKLIERYGPRVLGLCKVILVDALEAESVTSDVFLELWNRPQAYSTTRGSLGNFLLVLARSRSIDRVRSRNARNKLFDATEQPTEKSSFADEPSMNAEKRERQVRIADALTQLPVGQRELLKLAFFQGLTHRQVAEMTEMPLGTVKTNIRSGLLRLRAILASEVSEGRLS